MSSVFVRTSAKDFRDVADVPPLVDDDYNDLKELANVAFLSEGIRHCDEEIEEKDFNNLFHDGICNPVTVAAYNDAPFQFEEEEEEISDWSLLADSDGSWNYPGDDPSVWEFGSTS